MTKKKNDLTFTKANVALERPLTNKEKEKAKKKIKKHMIGIFDALKIDYQNDHNTEETPERIAKMFVEELFKGRFNAAPKITSFKNVDSYDQLLTVGPIDVKSMCSHHFIPIRGYAIIGLLPKKESKLIGLSKYARIVDHFSRRPQIQEELATQIADHLDNECGLAGIAVKIVAEHLCMTHRGVNEPNSLFDTTVVRGVLKESKSAKDEFLRNAAEIAKQYTFK